MKTPSQTDRLEFWKHSLARASFVDVRIFIEELLASRLPMEHPVRKALSIAILTAYGRPFRQRKVVRLPEQIVPHQYKELHDSLIEIRDRVVAHRDVDGTRAGWGFLNQLEMHVANGEVVLNTSSPTMPDGKAAELLLLIDTLLDALDAQVNLFAMEHLPSICSRTGVHVLRVDDSPTEWTNVITPLLGSPRYPQTHLSANRPPYTIQYHTSFVEAQPSAQESSHVHVRHVSITAAPCVPWRTLVLSASSAELEENDPVFGVKEAIATYGPPRDVSVNLVSFGERVLQRDDVLQWASENHCRLATPRELLTIPPYHKDFYRMLGYFAHARAPDQHKSFYMEGGICGGPSPVKTPYRPSSTQVLCLQPIEMEHIEYLLSIDCADHGDFDYMSYWPQLYVFDEHTGFDGRPAIDAWTKSIGCVWFALVPLPTLRPEEPV